MLLKKCLLKLTYIIVRIEDQILGLGFKIVIFAKINRKVKPISMHSRFVKEALNDKTIS